MTEDQILKRRKKMIKERILKGIKDRRDLIKIYKDQIEGIGKGFFFPGEDCKAMIKRWEAKICEHERTISQLRAMLKGEISNDESNSRQSDN